VVNAWLVVNVSHGIKVRSVRPLCTTVMYDRSFRVYDKETSLGDLFYEICTFVTSKVSYYTFIINHTVMSKHGKDKY
jgi:hypothetical protein